MNGGSTLHGKWRGGRRALKRMIYQSSSNQALVRPSRTQMLTPVTVKTDWHTNAAVSAAIVVHAEVKKF
jgi:hypothetical protein